MSSAARRVRVDLHAVPHVEYAVHLAPRGLRLLLDQPEQQRGIEQIVLDYVEPVDEVQDFGLSSAAAMDHAPDIAPVLVENRADDGSVGARGRKHELAYRQRAAGTVSVSRYLPLYTRSEGVSGS